MTLPEYEGRYKCKVLDGGVSHTGQNNLVTVILHLALFEYLDNDGEWAPCEREITAYNYIQKKDGTINESCLSQLRAAFGWDGKDIFAFQDAAAELPECQCVVVMDEYQGKTRPKVTWLRPIDYEGSSVLPKATEDEKKRIRTEIGSRLRALAGTAPSTAPAPAPKVSPIMPAPAPAPAPAVAPEPKTLPQIWEECYKLGKNRGIGDDDLSAMWSRCYDDVIGERQPRAEDIEPMKAKMTELILSTPAKVARA